MIIEISNGVKSIVKQKWAKKKPKHKQLVSQVYKIYDNFRRLKRHFHTIDPVHTQIVFEQFFVSFLMHQKRFRNKVLNGFNVLIGDTSQSLRLFIFLYIQFGFQSHFFPVHFRCNWFFHSFHGFWQSSVFACLCGYAFIMMPVNSILHLFS